MTAEIFAVGTELLMGQIANTNAQYISSKLPDIGINVFFHQVAGDNPSRLKDALSCAIGRSDIVIMTGGLGPTMDDLTKEAVAAYFGLQMALDEESLSRIRARMSRGAGAGTSVGAHAMPKNNERQAYFPEGAIIMRNDHGTAPGCIIENGGKTVIMLPGPPSEMRPMFDDHVMPFLSKYAEYRLESRFLRIFGIGESRLEEMLNDLVEAQTNPTLATYAKEGEVTIRVTARYPCGNDVNCNVINDDIISPIVDIIRARVGDRLFSVEDEELADAAFNALARGGLTLSLAESCTGGLLASRITDIPGASKVFLSSAVTYSNEAKMSMLGVRAETLSAYGAVSAQTAREMADGARRLFGSDIAVAVTGIAGPDGGSDEKPVGLVYLALSDANGVVVRELRLTGTRSRIRNVTCLNAFDMMRRAALGLPQPE